MPFTDPLVEPLSTTMTADGSYLRPCSEARQSLATFQLFQFTTITETSFNFPALRTRGLLEHYQLEMVMKRHVLKSLLGP